MEKNLSGGVTNSTTQKIAAKPHTARATVTSSTPTADTLTPNQETANFSPPSNEGNQTGGSNKSDGR
jgi:hypothetical protein